MLVALFLLLEASALLYAEPPPPPPPYGNRSIGGNGGSRSSVKSKLPFGYIGVHGGMANPPSSVAASSRMGLGVSTGIRLSPEVTIGAFLLYTSQVQNSGYPAPYDRNVLTIIVAGAELSYTTRFWDVFAATIGARFGPSKITIDSSGLRSSSTHPLAYGPTAGLDIFIRKELSFGGDATALFFGDAIHYAPFVTTYLNGSIKLWF